MRRRESFSIKNINDFRGSRWAITVTQLIKAGVGRKECQKTSKAWSSRHSMAEIGLAEVGHQAPAPCNLHELHESDSPL